MTNQLSLNGFAPEMSPLLQFLRPNTRGNMLRKRFFEDIDRKVGEQTTSIRESVLGVLDFHITEPDLLDGISCTGSALQYTRTLLHAGSGYSILAIVWLPGQMSPVHGHKAWCALGVHQGELVETYLKASSSGKTNRNELQVTGCRQLAAGAVSGSEAEPDFYHRMANLGVVPAVSIHVYGAAFDCLGTDLNRLWPG